MRNYDLRLIKIQQEFENLPDGVNKTLWLQSQMDQLQTQLMNDCKGVAKRINFVYNSLIKKAK
jgi:hypothetical protein